MMEPLDSDVPNLRSIDELINARVRAGEEAARIRLDDLEDRLTGIESRLSALLQGGGAAAARPGLFLRPGRSPQQAAPGQERLLALVQQFASDNAQLQSRVNVLQDRVHDLERALDGFVDGWVDSEAAAVGSLQQVAGHPPVRLRLG